MLDFSGFSGFSGGLFKPSPCGELVSALFFFKRLDSSLALAADRLCPCQAVVRYSYRPSFLS